MILPGFTYHAPEAVDEAIALLTEFHENGKLLAGGTDLLPRMRAGRLQVGHLVSTRRLDELRGVGFDREKGLSIGAAEPLDQVRRACAGHYPVVAEAISSLATPQVRNRATVAGNICNASPCADTATPLMALGATVEISGDAGERTMTVEEFIRGPGQTALEPGELVRKIRVPPPDPGLRTFFAKVSPRSQVDISAVSVTLAIKTEKRTVEAVDLFLGTVGPRPMRARQAESLLLGNELTGGLIERAASAARDECSPISDLRAKHDYKKRMVRLLTRRLLERAIADP